MPTFFQSVERGFAQGVGTLVAYGIALLLIGWLVGGQAQAQTGSGTTAQPTSSTGSACPGTYA